MSDIKLFRTSANSAVELRGHAVTLEKSLQSLIEQNMDSFLGVRFLESEFATSHGGRMDSIGIDENGSPVIIEYKRASNENIINQGLFYLDWLMDHKKDFLWLVMSRYGQAQANAVDWSAPRLICIAGDFTKFDVHAVNQMKRNIELIRYRRFGEELLLFEVLTSVINKTIADVNQSDSSVVAVSSEIVSNKQKYKQKTITQYMEGADPDLMDLYWSINAYLSAMGDDVQVKTVDNYIAFRRLKNFACVEIKPKIRHIKIFVKVDPSTVEIEPGFTRDVREIGHFGTGDLEIIVTDQNTFNKAKPLLDRSYDAA